MKYAVSLLSLAAFAQVAPAPAHAELSQVQTVYLLKMKSGFDQHLANRLTGSALFRVVTDPEKADAIFTDHLGKGFEEQMKELYPPPVKEEPAKAPAPESEDPAILPDIKSSERPRSTFGSSSGGTVFLVDRRSQQVIWSTYAKPKSYSTNDLDSNAANVVKRLQETLQPKK